MKNNRQIRKHDFNMSGAGEKIQRREIVGTVEPLLQGFINREICNEIVDMEALLAPYLKQPEWN